MRMVSLWREHWWIDNIAQNILVSFPDNNIFGTIVSVFMVITTIGSVPLYMSPICEVVETSFGSMKAGKYFIGNGKAIAFRVIMVALISLVAFIFPYFSDVLSFNILRMLIGSSFTSTWKFYIHSRSNDSSLFDPFDLFLEDSVDPFQDSRWDSNCSVIYNDGCMYYCFSSEITWFNGLVHFFCLFESFYESTESRAI